MMAGSSSPSVTSLSEVLTRGVHCSGEGSFSWWPRCCLLEQTIDASSRHTELPTNGCWPIASRRHSPNLCRMMCHRRWTACVVAFALDLGGAVLFPLEHDIPLPSSHGG